MHVFIMLPFFSDISKWCQKVHSKYVCREMFAFAMISVIHFAKDIAFLYHDIPFVYIAIIMRFYITIYHLS